MTFEAWMRDQYQWDEQFDMESQYSQLDMEKAFSVGRSEGIKWAERFTAEQCIEVVECQKLCHDDEILLVRSIKENFKLEI